jgi:hypothetical protein
MVGIFFTFLFASLVPSFSSYVINDKYIYINGSKFAYFGWLATFDENLNGQNLITAKIGNDNIDLDYWFNCLEDYYRCSASYIKYFYLPYLYWNNILKSDYSTKTYNIEYAGELNDIVYFNIEPQDKIADSGVNVIFSRIPNETYYKNYYSIYFSFLPNQIIINSNDNLTNTQYYFQNTPYFKIYYENEEKYINLMSYPNFYLFKGIPTTTSSTYIPVKEDLKDKKIFEPSFNSEVSYNSTSRGRIDLTFTSLIKHNSSNRFIGIEYEPVVDWYYYKGSNKVSGSSESKMKSYYSFVKGPNNVIYLENISIE